VEGVYYNTTPSDFSNAPPPDRIVNIIAEM